MKYGIAFFTLFVVLSSSSPCALVIDLAYEKAEESPSYILSSPLIDAGGWENADRHLTEGSLTIRPTLHLPSGDESVTLLISIDRSSGEAQIPDTLYIDLDDDRRIGDEERFALRPARQENNVDGSYSMLCAEKVPLVFSGSPDPRDMNVYAMVTTDSDIGKVKYVPIGLSGWGCYRGAAEIEGQEYEVVLYDRNGNGRFGDVVDESPWDADMLLIRPNGNKDETPKPLRNRLVAGGKAYSVKVEENGRKMHLDLLDVKFGKVAAARPDLTFNLDSSEWGPQYVMPGEVMEVPAGAWTISYFNRVGDDGATFCVFSCKSARTVDVTVGEKSVVDFDTKVKTRIDAEKEKDGFTLNLNLTTAEGSRFRGYYSQTERFDGVPFRILDESGGEVEKGVFKFG
jgi:hypothetical protein